MCSVIVCIHCNPGSPILNAPDVLGVDHPGKTSQSFIAGAVTPYHSANANLHQNVVPSCAVGAGSQWGEVAMFEACTRVIQPNGTVEGSIDRVKREIRSRTWSCHDGDDVDVRRAQTLPKWTIMSR